MGLEKNKKKICSNLAFTVSKQSQSLTKPLCIISEESRARTCFCPQHRPMILVRTILGRFSLAAHVAMNYILIKARGWNTHISSEWWIWTMVKTLWPEGFLSHQQGVWPLCSGWYRAEVIEFIQWKLIVSCCLWNGRDTDSHLISVFSFFFSSGICFCR